jgi:hypothetical protein
MAIARLQHGIAELADNFILRTRARDVACELLPADRRADKRLEIGVKVAFSRTVQLARERSQIFDFAGRRR